MTALRPPLGDALGLSNADDSWSVGRPRATDGLRNEPGSGGRLAGQPVGQRGGNRFGPRRGQPVDAMRYQYQDDGFPYTERIADVARSDRAVVGPPLLLLVLVEAVVMDGELRTSAENGCSNIDRRPTAF